MELGFLLLHRAGILLLTSTNNSNGDQYKSILRRRTNARTNAVVSILWSSLLCVHLHYFGYYIIICCGEDIANITHRVQIHSFHFEKMYSILYTILYFIQIR